jgi:eukaryotic-like serine/threonine-protein kinase
MGKPDSPAKPQSPSETATDCQEEGAPSKRPEPISVVVVPGFTPLVPTEVETLLRRRLRIGVLIVIAGISFEVLALTLGPIFFSSSGFLPLALVANVVVLVVTGAVAKRLWGQRELSLSQLRVIELISLGALIGIESWAQYRILQAWLPAFAAIGEFPVIVLAHSSSLFWVTTIVGYGAFIPNTWHRCIAVLTIVASLPLAIAAFVGLSGDEVPIRMASRFLLQMGMWLAIAVTISVYGSHRIEVLRQQASEARKLGQYQLKKRLGAGGMGEVHLAEHVLLQRPCAVKLIRPGRTVDSMELRRFEREVRATATLTHPNTVQIFDYGHTEDGTFYYAMEYLPGLTLEQLVKQHGPLVPSRAVYFVRQICGALREAHAIGLIHRDIKPSNVMICARGGLHDTAKLLDFGLVLAQRGNRDSEKLTQDGAIAGTPAYMSPEQIDRHNKTDLRSDIYSVGALTYFLLTGQPPFAGLSPAKTLAAHLYEMPAPLTRHRLDVPLELEAIVLRCMAKNPADRFPDARSLDSALADCHAVGQWTEQEAADWWRFQ